MGGFGDFFFLFSDIVYPRLRGSRSLSLETLFGWWLFLCLAFFGFRDMVFTTFSGTCKQPKRAGGDAIDGINEETGKCYFWLLGRRHWTSLDSHF